jgi:hypothetical protein
MGPLTNFLAAHGAAAGLLVLAVPAAAAAAGPGGAMHGQNQQQNQQQQQQQVLLKLDAAANREQLMDCSSKVSIAIATALFCCFTLTSLLVTHALLVQYGGLFSAAALIRNCRAVQHANQLSSSAQPAKPPQNHCRTTAKPLHLLLLLPPQGNAVGAVSCALSLVAVSAGLRFAPLSLMAERVTAGLQVLAAKHR